MAEQRMAKPAADSKKIYGVYIKSMLSTKVVLNMNEVGKNVKQNLERMISKQIEGKCVTEGFIRPGSTRVISYSAGVVNNGIVEFQVVMECMVCNPVEGMLIECVVKTITKAGVHAEVIDSDSSVVPIVAFLARDHNYSDKQFALVKENAKITVRVIGCRFELFDKNIWVIGKLVEQDKLNIKQNEGKYKKPLHIGGDDDSDDE